MRIMVNGVRLFVDIEGVGLVPDGAKMRAKPTLVVLHGGPGADHSIYKPDYGEHLSDLCQTVYLDHRGNGRSDDGDPALWNLAQWGEDVDALMGILGVERPIIFGASFGGFVAQSYATRHADKIGGLILSNTAAKVDFEAIYSAFTRVGGEEAGQAARAYWSAPTPETRRAYADACLHYYSRRPTNPDFWNRVMMKDPVAIHFNGEPNEMGRFDFRTALGAVKCPSLVISGAHDPIMPPALSDPIVAGLSAAKVTAHCLPDSAHMTASDEPDRFFALLRDFISRISHA